MSGKKHSKKRSHEVEMIGKVMLVNKPKGLYRLYPTFKGHDYVLMETQEIEAKKEFISRLFGSDVNGSQQELVDVPHSGTADANEFFKEMGYKLTKN